MIVSLFLAAFSVMSIVGFANVESREDTKHIKLLTKAVEIVSATTGTDKCKDKKGITLKLKVTSESPVDVLRYVKIKDTWAPTVFPNQKKGDEISDYACREDAPFQFFSRPAGSSENFPKPQ